MTPREFGRKMKIMSRRLSKEHFAFTAENVEKLETKQELKRVLDGTLSIGSVIETLHATVVRTIIYTHSPYYTNIVAQIKDMVKMMRAFMKFAELKSSELDKIMDDVVELHDAYMTDLKRRAEDAVSISN